MENINIDPRKMLLVTLREMSGDEKLYSAISCSYVTVISSCGRIAINAKCSRDVIKFNGTSIAIEVAIDPVEPTPTTPYSCPVDRLSRIVVSPARLVKVSPYIK
jgi:hypothetical protein